MLAERVLKVLTVSQVIADANKLVVAVSGGCDSVALLHILKDLRHSLGVDLHVASLDHGIRGAQGQGDLDFVRELAGAWGLPHTPGQVDVPRLASAWGMGIETAARRARYDFLAQVALQEACQGVATGHHADDQAETILMNIVRGSGMRGLGGMRPESLLPGHPQFKLIRPLLAVSRRELETYCREHNLAFRQDETNWDTTYGRNFLRHEVLDKLARLNPAVVSALNRLAESAAVDEDFVNGQLESLARVALRSWDGGCSISRPLFLEAHPALQRRLLRQAFHQLAGAGASLAHDRALDLAGWCKTARTGASRDIGAGLELRVTYDAISIQRSGRHEPRSDYRLIPTNTDIALAASDRLELGGVSVDVKVEPGKCDKGTAIALPAGCELRLRTRRAGDRFKPKGMAGRSRKLKDWMIDRKIPRHIRDQIPLLCANGAIVAIGLGAAWHVAELSDQQAAAGSKTIVCLD